MIDYPIPKFHFQVEIEGFENRFSFTEVTGLNTNIETGIPIFRFPNVKIFKVLTCKRGIIIQDEAFNNWIESCLLIPPNLRQISHDLRRNITIYLMDEKHVPKIKWEVQHALPICFSTIIISPNEKVIEKFELEYELSSYIVNSL